MTRQIRPYLDLDELHLKTYLHHLGKILLQIMLTNILFFVKNIVNVALQIFDLLAKTISNVITASIFI